MRMNARLMFSASELAQAHANRLRQTLDGEHFGDVIADASRTTPWYLRSS